MYDITNLMTWFISEVIRIFQFSYFMLENITFMGTNLLSVSIMLLIIGALIKVTLVVPKGTIPNGSEIKQRKEKTKHDTKSK